MIKSQAPLSLNQTIHPGAVCSECRVSPIIGLRFDCEICNMTFCQKCALDESVHDPTHSKTMYMRPKKIEIPKLVLPNSQAEQIYQNKDEEKNESGIDDSYSQ